MLMVSVSNFGYWQKFADNVSTIDNRKLLTQNAQTSLCTTMCAIVKTTGGKQLFLMNWFRASSGYTQAITRRVLLYYDLGIMLV